MRTFLPFGSLVVSRGLGSCGDEEIVFPEEELPEGIGRNVRINVASADAPKALIRYPAKKTGKCND
jgi:hypothetical protein